MDKSIGYQPVIDSVLDAFKILLKHPGSDESITNALAGIGMAANVDRVYIFQITQDATGAYVRAFHEAGVHTWGTDLSPEMIAVARQRDPDNAATYTVADMRDVFTHPAAPFDLVFSIGNTLAHLSDWGTVRNWIETLPAALRTESGSVVVQFVDLSSLGSGSSRDLPVLHAKTDSGPVEMRRRYTRTDDHHYRMDAWLTVPEVDTAEHEISQTLLVLDTDSVVAAFRAGGFSDIATYGGFDRTATDPDLASWVRVIEAHRG